MQTRHQQSNLDLWKNQHLMNNSMENERKTRCNGVQHDPPSAGGQWAGVKAFWLPNHAQ